MENIALSGAITLFNAIIDDVYGHGKQKIKTELDKRAAKNKTPQLVRNQLDFIGRVKTLWQVDRAVDIDQFYCDSHVIPPLRKGEQQRSPDVRRTIVKSVSGFTGSRNVVIRGIAGQGKSIFLRYLCVRQFESGQKIPIFIELRRIRPDETLFYHFAKFFEILDLSIDRDSFRLLAKSGRFIFFLDAFDEIDPGIEQKILNEIEDLASLCPNCQFIITTRPGTSIEMSATFDVWTLDDLRADEYKQVIRKLADSSESAETIIQAIASHTSSVSELLCTPLLVTLLIITYKSYSKIPEHLSDFYESIFSVLLQRHDGTKPGFTRSRSCLINDSQYRNIFDALCYETKSMRKLTFTHQDLCRSITKAMSIFNLPEDPDRYLKDIVTITCLILHEGEYRFIHRTVQDYYASTFIKNRPETVVIRFYTSCIDLDKWRRWQSPLSFLSSIDTYRYYKYFIMPLCRNWLRAGSDDALLSGCTPITKEEAKHIIGDISIVFNIDSSKINPYGHLSLVSFGKVAQLCDLNTISQQIVSMNYDKLIQKLQNGEIKPSTKPLPSKLFFPKGRQAQLDFAQILDNEETINDHVLSDKLKALTEYVRDLTFNTWKSAYDYTTHMESVDIVSDSPSDDM